MTNDQKKSTQSDVSEQSDKQVSAAGSAKIPAKATSETPAKASGTSPALRPGSALAVMTDSFSATDLQSWHRDINTDPRRLRHLAFIVLIVVVGFGGLWGATAKIGGAVIGSGRVVAEGRNRVVQHLEGGILKEIMVREGDRVGAGDILARLDDTQILTQLNSERLQAAILRVQLARRRAEITNRSEIDIPSDFAEHIALHPRLKESIATQLLEFKALRELRDTEIASIEQQIKGFKRRASGSGEVLEAQIRQADLLKRELSDLDQLVQKELIRRAEIFARQRALAEVQGQIANSQLQVAIAEGEAENLANSILQTQQGYIRDASAALVEIQQRLNQVDQTVERLVDIYDRGVIRSPVDGTIFRIAKRTLGAVLQPAESIMEIFPEGDTLTVEASIEIKDIEQVSMGQDVRIVFPSNRDDGLVPIPGVVTYISADAVQPQDNSPGYYVARIRISDTDLVLLPGNAAEVYFQTTPKTFFQYITEPVTRFAFRAFKG